MHSSLRALGTHAHRRRLCEPCSASASTSRLCFRPHAEAAPACVRSARRVVKSQDELHACLPAEGGSLTSSECATALDSTDDEFWLSSQPNGYQHTGLFSTWNISTDRSEYAVLAETEEDFQATCDDATLSRRFSDVL